MNPSFILSPNQLFEALMAMKAKAESMEPQVTGVARVAVLDPTADYTLGSLPILALELVVGRAFRPIDPNREQDDGRNFGAIADSKWWESFLTHQDSGVVVDRRPPLKGEHGYKGGAFRFHPKGIMDVTFSGGSSAEDFQISEAGIEVLEGYLNKL